MMLRIWIIPALVILGFSSTALAEPLSPSDVYRLHNEAIINHAPLEEVDKFLSSQNIEAREEFYKKYGERKGKSREEIVKMMGERAQYRAKCTAHKNLIDTKKVSEKKVLLTYRFEDSCAGNANASAVQPVVASIAEITMVYQDGWKIDSTSARPEKPVKIKKIIQP